MPVGARLQPRYRRGLEPCEHFLNSFEFYVTMFQICFYSELKILTFVSNVKELFNSEKMLFVKHRNHHVSKSLHFSLKLKRRICI